MLSFKKIERKLKRELSFSIIDLKEQIKIKSGLAVKKHSILSFKTSIFKVASAIALIVLLISTTLISTQEIALASNYVTIDINPSIELVVDDKNIVTSQRGLNLDGKILLFEQNLVSLSIEEATDKIVSLSIELGYLSFENEHDIHLTSVSENQQTEDDFSVYFKNKLSASLIKNKITFQLKENKSDEIELANQYNITRGKLFLIKKAIEVDPNLNFDNLLSYTNKELNEIIKNYDEEEYENFDEFIQNEYQQDRQLIENYYRELNDDIKEIRDAIREIKNNKKSLSEVVQLLIDFKTKYDIEFSIQDFNLENIKNNNSLIEDIINTLKNELDNRRFNENITRVNEFKDKWQNRDGNGKN